MLDRLLKIEEQLARVEAALLVFFVLLMLGLATYNVFYRNILVPIQVDLLTAADSAVTADGEESKPVEVDEAAAEAEPAESDGAAGFGGGFGEGDDGAAGFGGGFDESAPDEPAAPDEPPEPDDPDDGAAGFGGDFGAPESNDGADDGAGGFGGGFDSPEGEAGEPTKEQTPSVSAASTESGGEEPPFIAKFIDWIKLEWIDQVLRQLVLLVGFLGAMLATRRRKHITIDALSKVVPDDALHWVHVVTNLVSVVVCVLLAVAGAKLVNIGIEYPKEIVSWADEWHFQLVFPVGFGLLVLHFVIRLIESIYYAFGKAEPRDLALPEGGEG